MTPYLTWKWFEFPRKPRVDELSLLHPRVPQCLRPLCADQFSATIMPKRLKTTSAPSRHVKLHVWVFLCLWLLLTQQLMPPLTRGEMWGRRGGEIKWFRLVLVEQGEQIELLSWHAAHQHLKYLHNLLSAFIDISRHFLPVLHYFPSQGIKRRALYSQIFAPGLAGSGFPLKLFVDLFH